MRVAQTRIEKHHQHIDRDIDADEEQRKCQHNGLNQRQVAANDGINRQTAYAGVAEQTLYQHGAPQNERELHRRQRQRRRDGIGQSLDQQHMHG